MPNAKTGMSVPGMYVPHLIPAPTSRYQCLRKGAAGLMPTAMTVIIVLLIYALIINANMNHHRYYLQDVAAMMKTATI
jgi:hypothetical protein